MTTFVETPVDNDPAQLEAEAVEMLESRFEGWEPADGDLATWLIKAFARLSSITREQAAETTAAMFKKFGETIVNVPPIHAAPATATSTWTMIDDAGYTIPAGTTVVIPGSGDRSVAFEVVVDVTVEPGSTATEAGEVELRAIEPGADGNGLTDAPTLLDALAFVASITLVGATSGGVDEEDEDDYLDRLTEALQLLSLSLIVEEDFEKDARAVAGVDRALCLGGYNAETEEDEQPLVVTVFPVDAEGKALSAEAKAALLKRQQEKVPVGVEVFVDDPTYTAIDVEAEIEVLPGYDSASTVAAVEEALDRYLSPANWGKQTQPDEPSPGFWHNATTVYFYELISEIDRVAGVSRVVSAKIAKASGELKAEDISLAGPAPLTEAGTLTVTAT